MRDFSLSVAKALCRRVLDMNATTNNTTQLQLLRQRPRRVRIKPRKSNLFFKLFIVPHMLWAYSSLFTLLLAMVVVIFGSNVTGKVLSANTTGGKKPKYTIEYSYAVGSQVFIGRNDVSQEEYNSLKVRDTIAVRHLKTRTETDSQIVFSQNRWSHVQSLLFDTIFINIIVGVFVYGLYVLPALQRRLISRGVATLGHITEVRKVNGKSTTYELTYTFAPIEYTSTILNNSLQFLPKTQRESPEIESKIQVLERDFTGADVGDQVTIIFDERKARRNLIYRFADYEIV